MPAKNTVKNYVEGGCYHLYNRGVEKRKIFLDDQDYKTYLFLLKTYLSPKPPKGSDPKMAYYNKKNLYGDIELLAYCLMPNHFHLLVRQNIRQGITDLMRCVNTNYVAYFNKKYQRVGTLFQGRYKAVLVESDPYLLHLTRYIHLNPTEIVKNSKSYGFSSYQDYLGKKDTNWLNKDFVLEYFKNARKGDGALRDYSSYESFVEDYALESKESLGDLTIEAVH